MFTLIVTVLAVLVVVGFLFRIADSQALRADNPPRPPVHPRAMS